MSFIQENFTSIVIILILTAVLVCAWLLRKIISDGAMTTWSFLKEKTTLEIRFSLKQYLIGVVAMSCYTLVLWFCISMLQPVATEIVGFGVIALVTFAVLLPWIPNATKYLSNDPNRFEMTVTEEAQKKGDYPSYTFGFFTQLAPGQVKVIVRGKRFIRCTMKLDNHTFRGETSNDIERNQQEYWDVIKTPNGYVDFHPTPDRGMISWINPLWWWGRYVYSIAGAVFTGIPPFQNVRTYKLSRLQKILNPDGSFSFEPKTDYSDHYRAADTQLFVEVPDADTADKIPVTVKKAITGRVTNAYSTAYSTDENWTTRFFTTVADGVNRYTRSRPLDDVLSIAKGGDTGAFGKAMVEQLNHTPKEGADADGRPTVSNFGLLISEAAVLDISITDPITRKRFEDEAVSEVDARARENRGRGEANAVELLITAATAKGEEGLQVYETEARVRLAEATGISGGTVILDAGGSGRRTISPEVALLRQSIEGDSQ